MPFRHARQCDDRRRRLLQEEVSLAATSAVVSGGAASPKKKSPRYTEAAQMDRQPRVTDLIPQRIRTLVGLFLLGASFTAGLVWLYAWMPAVAAHTTDGRVAAFDLDGEGSLGSWFSSVILAWAGLTAALVYTLRRHRIDDYKGRYRVWLAAAFVWLVMSADECGSLHEGFKEMMVHLTGHRIAGDGSLWWVLAYGLVLGLVGLRLLLDMRECKSSTAAFALAGGCYAVAVATQLGWLLPDYGARAVMLEEACEMSGNLFLWLSMTLHARYIIRDIEGVVVRKEVKPAIKKPKADKPKPVSSPSNVESGGSARRVDSGEKAATSRPKKKRKQPAEAAASTSPSPKPSGKSQPSSTGQNASTNRRADAPEQPSPSPHRKLSKAERKALRRQKRQESRAQ